MDKGAENVAKAISEKGENVSKGVVKAIGAYGIMLVVSSQAATFWRISTLEKKICGDINKISGDINKLESKISGDINKISGDINQLESKLSGDINKLESKISGDFSSLISKLTSLESRMDTHETLASERHQVILRELTRLQK